MTNHPSRKQVSADGWPIRMTPEQLRDLRARSGMTQTQAAELCGAALRTYQQWEAGDRAMPKSASGLLCCACVIVRGAPAMLMEPWLPRPVAGALTRQRDSAPPDGAAD